MKLLTTVLLGLTAATLVSSTASAVPELYITGSTAYRASVQAAIIGYLSTGGATVYATYAKSGATTPPTTGNTTASNLFKASQAVYTNSTGTAVIHTDFTGSLAGVVDVVASTPRPFLPDSAVSTSNSAEVVNLSAGQYGAATGAATSNFVPNFTFSDSYVSSIATVISGANIDGTGTIDGTQDPNQLANNILGAGLVAAGTATVTNPDGGTIKLGSTGVDAVGIVPFGWWNGKATTAPGITNVTQQAAYALTQGPVPVSFFNGNSSQKNAYVYLVGRNEDSGTRIAALAETSPLNGYGIGTPVVQYQLTFSGSTITTDSNGLATGGSAATDVSLKLWPATAPLYTENFSNVAIDWDTTGHSGYIAGGDVANVLSANNPGLKYTAVSDGSNPPGNTGTTGYVYLMGYLGWADGYGISGTGTTPLTYNGVALNAANIQNGTYSFWAFEHAYYIPASGSNGVGSSTATGTARNVADSIANLIITTYAPSNNNGHTASATFPAATATPTPGTGNTDTNEDLLTTDDGAAPAGILYDTAVLTTRTIEGGQLSSNY